jgi:predicted nucleotidyltransferase component of viral defense system
VGDGLKGINVSKVTELERFSTDLDLEIEDMRTVYKRSKTVGMWVLTRLE